ncbi:MAG: hypothetical protein ACOZCL_08880 [Bacillota bacterium]
MKTKKISRCITAIVLCVIFIFGSIVPVAAWKPKTHTYIGSVILKELREKNGYVEIPPFGLFKVKKEYLELFGTVDEKGNFSLEKYNNNAAYFIGGNVGPDMYPDIYVGQAIFHPDNSPMISGDWIKEVWDSANNMPEGKDKSAEPIGHYISHDINLDNVIDTTGYFLTKTSLKEASQAFALGFELHGAGDLFGHTWVNKWAQGAFPEVSDGSTDEEKNNIKRHFAVEALVAKETQGAAPLAPREFILRHLIYNGGSASKGLNPLYYKGSIGNIPMHIQVFASLRNELHQFCLDYHYSDSALVQDALIYARAWIDDIDKGMRAWVYANSSLARKMLGYNDLTGKESNDETIFPDNPKPIDPDSYPTAGDIMKEWISNYAYSMVGVPDAIVAIGKVLGPLMDVLLGPIALANSLLIDYFLAMGVDYLFTEVFGLTYDEMKFIDQYPDIHITDKLYGTADALAKIKEEMGNVGTAKVDMSSFRQYHFQDTEVPINNLTFDALHDSIIMAKLVMIGHEGIDELLSRALGRNVVCYTDPSRINEPILGFMRSFDESHCYDDPDFPLYSNTEFRQKVFYLLFQDLLFGQQQLDSEISYVRIHARKHNDVTGSYDLQWHYPYNGTYVSSSLLPTEIKVETSAATPVELFVFNSNHRLLYRGIVEAGERATKFKTTELYGKGSFFAYATPVEANDILKGKKSPTLSYDFPVYNENNRDGAVFPVMVNRLDYPSDPVPGYGPNRNFPFIKDFETLQLFKTDPMLIVDGVNDPNVNYKAAKEMALRYGFDYVNVIAKNLESDVEHFQHAANTLNASDGYINFGFGEEAGATGAWILVPKATSTSDDAAAGTETTDVYNATIMSDDTIVTEEAMETVASEEVLQTDIAGETGTIISVDSTVTGDYTVSETQTLSSSETADTDGFSGTIIATDPIPVELVPSIVNIAGISVNRIIPDGMTLQDTFSFINSNSSLGLSIIEAPCEIYDSTYDDRANVCALSWKPMAVISGRYDILDRSSIDKWIKHGLAKGLRTPAVGGSGTYIERNAGLESKRAAERIGYTATYVFAESNTKEAIADGIKKGRCFVSTGPHVSFYLQLDKDQYNNRTKFYRMGDTVPVDSDGESVALYISTTPGYNYGGEFNVYVYQGGYNQTERLIKSYTTTSGFNVIGKYNSTDPEIRMMPCTYFRVEVRSATNPKIIAISNPIYCNYDTFEEPVITQNE